MQKKVKCPFTDLDCPYYKARVSVELMTEKQISSWCLLCVLGQIFQILKLLSFSLSKPV